MSNFTVQCANCSAMLDECARQPDGPPCPYCGSIFRHVNIGTSDDIGLQLKEMVGVKAKDASRAGKHKITIEQVAGDELNRTAGVWVRKVRVIDRANDRYLEEVTDPQTGTVIHRCDEPLSDHIGHGADKTRAAGD